MTAIMVRTLESDAIANWNKTHTERIELIAH